MKFQIAKNKFQVSEGCSCYFVFLIFLLFGICYLEFENNSYICTHKFRGYGEIGRHARLRIWCRKACRFESYYPHKKLKRRFGLFYWKRMARASLVSSFPLSAPHGCWLLSCSFRFLLSLWVRISNPRYRVRIVMVITCTVYITALSSFT